MDYITCKMKINSSPQPPSWFGYCFITTEERKLAQPTLTDKLESYWHDPWCHLEAMTCLHLNAGPHTCEPVFMPHSHTHEKGWGRVKEAVQYTPETWFLTRFEGLKIEAKRKKAFLSAMNISKQAKPKWNCFTSWQTRTESPTHVLPQRGTLLCERGLGKLSRFRNSLW